MRHALLALAATAGLCATLHAQPKLIITGIGTDFAASGNGAAGLVAVGLHDPNSGFTVPAITWTRGVGYSIIPGASRKGTDGVSCSADLSVLAMSTNNALDWGALNCFTGYNTTTGAANPPATPPCDEPGITHRWTAASGWVNTGSFPRFPDPLTGRLIGGTKCDFDISSPKDVSGDGRYILANGWYARSFNSSGGISAGFCGNFFGYTYDGQTGTITQLPVQPGTTTSRADVINYNGSVITGYDLNSAESTRRLCVWRNGVQTILDPYLGAKDSAGISGPGSFVATGASTQFVSNTWGESGVRLVRWQWTGSAWQPQNLGKPADYIDPNIGVPIEFSDLWVTGVSDDGNTIVGSAQYGPPPPTLGGIRRPFIWRPSINGGVPMDFEAYITSIGNPNEPIFPTGHSPTYPVGLSADGNAVLLTIHDSRNTCPWPNRSHDTFTAGIVYINGAGIACDPPRIGVGPESWTDWSGLRYGVSLNVVASGSWPLTYQWQREDPLNPNTWITLQESCQNFNEQINWDYEGVNKNQLRIGSGNLGGGRGGRYRVVITNSCGSVTSQPATVTFITGACCLPSGTCVQDFQYPCLGYEGTFAGPGTSCETSCNSCYANCDGSTGTPRLTANDFQCFINLYAAGSSGANCDGSTVAPTLTANDFQCFLNRYAEGCS